MKTREEIQTEIQRIQKKIGVLYQDKDKGLADTVLLSNFAGYKAVVGKYLECRISPHLLLEEVVNRCRSTGYKNSS